MTAELSSRIAGLLPQQQQAGRPIGMYSRANPLNLSETLVCFSELLLLMFESRYL
jgi:hypothetical protein